MPVLDSNLRGKLRETVKAARDEAEAGARAALESLAVHAPEPFPHLSDADRALRRRLRARARQLGDRRDSADGHQIDHLVVECAYEHWHRMLFARFLAENGVLMHPEGVAVTLEECEELAKEEGAANGWELAGRYASRMLPQIFRPDAPVLEVMLPPERQHRIEQLLAEQAEEVFKASDSLGWVYQFWQEKKKDEVNGSDDKVGADGLPAVTQLFTEPYMVAFLLHNSLGAWWVGAGRTLPPGLELPYLRVLEDGTPAAGKYEGWPEKTAELRVLDPCCGSGHFLVAAFHILVPFHMAEGELSAAEACEVTLRDNLCGLELDERCTQLSAFALALAAWTYPGAGGWRPLPKLNIACSGLSVALLPEPDETEEETREKKEENKRRRERWIVAAGKVERKRQGMMRLFDHFAEAPLLGSLVDPTKDVPMPLLCASADELRPLLERVMREAAQEIDEEERESRVAASGIAEAARILSDRYHLVATNVPYLTRGKQSVALRHYCDRHYSDAKGDLANVFLERCIELSASKGAGCVQIVMPQNWLFISSFKKQRERLLRSASWNLLALFGMGAFQIMDWWAFNTMALTLTNTPPPPDFSTLGVDAGAPRGWQDKAAALRDTPLIMAAQREQRKNVDCRIIFSSGPSNAQSLSEFAESAEGLSSGDGPRYILHSWEMQDFGDAWVPLQTGPSESQVLFGGQNQILRWDRGDGPLCASSAARVQGQLGWGRAGILVSEMNNLRACIHLGFKHDKTCGVIIPKNQEHLPALWAYCSSEKYREAVRVIDPALKVAPNSLIKAPFDLSQWQENARRRFANGLPKPYSDDPTQWLFHGHPAPATEPLQVAVARLLGYRWPAETDEEMELSDEARAWIERVKALDRHKDDDGIVPIPAAQGEEPAAERLLALLVDAFGEDWSVQKRDALLEQVGARGKGLDWWLREAFFEQHCKLFRHRPFVWQIWDGLKKDGFSALVNYHKLDRKLLESLTYTYLGDWIKRQHDDAGRNVDGALERLDAARALQDRLKLILEGQSPYDIFVRWKPLHEQPNGWAPDLNDGVRLNIRPFMSVPDVGQKGAGILRWKPNIHWKKDRGRDPSDAPWFRLGLEYGGKEGDRINDHHLTLEEKRQARDASKGV